MIFLFKECQHLSQILLGKKMEQYSLMSGKRFLEVFHVSLRPQKDFKQWGFNLNLSVHLLLRTTNNPSASVFNFVSLLILRIIVALTGLNASVYIRRLKCSKAISGTGWDGNL